jgi:hypothetical protein
MLYYDDETVVETVPSPPALATQPYLPTIGHHLPIGDICRLKLLPVAKGSRQEEKQQGRTHIAHVGRLFVLTHFPRPVTGPRHLQNFAAAFVEEKEGVKRPLSHREICSCSSGVPRFLGGVDVFLAVLGGRVTKGCIVGVHRPTFFACYITTTDAMHAQAHDRRLWRIKLNAGFAACAW